MKKLKVIGFLVIIIEIIGILNTMCYAGYSFSETTYNIDSVGVSLFSSPTDFLKHVLGFNFIFVPYIVIIIYIIIQIIIMKKYQKDKLPNNLKLCLKVNIIVILIICLVNTFINNYIIDKSKEVIYLTSTIFIQNSFFFVAEIINIVINTLILIFGIIFSKKILKNTTEENEKRQNKKMIIIIIVLIVILSGMHFIIKRGSLMHVVERDWIFGRTIDIRQYDLKVYKGKNIGDTAFLVKEIDDEGVLIEYERDYYDKQSSLNDSNTNYDCKTEIVQQKMKWNVNYLYDPEKDPMLVVDGGTDYYVRFEK